MLMEWNQLAMAGRNAFQIILFMYIYKFICCPAGVCLLACSASSCGEEDKEEFFFKEVTQELLLLLH